MDHELSKFLAVANWRSFTKAAKELHISQPALSMAIANLERKLGIKLLIRKRGNVSLTHEGKIVYDSARRMNLENDAMKQLLNEAGSGRDRPVSIGMIDSVGELVFSNDLPEKPALNVSIDSSSRLIQDVRLGRIEVGFIREQLGELPSSLEYSLIGYEDFVLVCSPDKSIFVRKMLATGQLKSWLSYNVGSATRQHMDSIWQERKIKTSVSFSSTSPSLIKVMARKGRGVALLPAQVVESDVNQKLLDVIDHGFRLPVWQVQLKGKYLGDDLTAVSDLVAKSLCRI